MTSPAVGITTIPVTDQPQMISNGLKGTLLLTNNDLNNEIWVSYGQAPAGSPSSVSVPPLGNITMTDTINMWAVCDPGNTAQLSVVPGGSTFSPSAVEIATQLLPLAADIAEEIAATGIPLVAGPTPLYDISSSVGSPILFGTNEASWTAQTGGTPPVTGMTTAIGYVPPTGPGFVDGIPVTWPSIGTSGTGTFPAGIGVPTVTFAPPLTVPYTSQQLAALNSYLSEAPNGARIMPYHEANGPATSSIATPAQINALDNYLITIVHAANPTLLYGRGISATSFNQGAQQGVTGWITPGMDFYGMDAYQASDASKTAEIAFGQALPAILAIQPNAAVHIIETGTALDVDTWMNGENGIVPFAITNGLAGVQTYFGAGTGTQNWNSTTLAAPINTASKTLGDAGSATTIGAGATLVLPPLNPSPVAGYAIANGLSYDLVVKLTAGASSTSPWLKLRLQWYDSDSTSALIVAEEQWSLPMGASTSNGTIIRGTGPQRGGYLQIEAINTDSVTCTIQAQSNSVGRTVNTDNLQWDAISSVDVPGYTLAPDGLGFTNCLGAVTSTPCPAASGGNPGTLSFLFGMYAGTAYVRFGSGASTPVIEVTLYPQPTSAFGSTLVGETLTGQADPTIGDFTGTVILPRAPCLVTFSNSDTVAHDVSAMIIAMS
jgi:hypothetical protein